MATEGKVRRGINQGRMGRPLKTRQARTQRVTVRVSDAEVAYIDAQRGGVSRAEWVRQVLAGATKVDAGGAGLFVDDGPGGRQ